MGFLSKLKSSKSKGDAPVSEKHASSTPPAYTSAKVPQGLENQLAALRRYDTVLLIDDSGSMAGRLWDLTAKALAGLVEVAVQYDADGVDLHFFNSTKGPQYGINSPEKLMKVFKQVSCGSGTPTASALKAITEPYMKTLEAWKANQELPKPKPINILCLTDGEPNRGQDPAPIIIDLAKRLDAMKLPLGQLGIQFVQIGNDPNAREALSHLDDNLQVMGDNGKPIRDICDTVLYEAGVEQDSAYVIKALLGGINKKLDGQDF